jgi:hypothetical protein
MDKTTSQIIVSCDLLSNDIVTLIIVCILYIVTIIVPYNNHISNIYIYINVMCRQTGLDLRSKDHASWWPATGPISTCLGGLGVATPSCGVAPSSRWAFHRETSGKKTMKKVDFTDFTE